MNKRDKDATIDFLKNLIREVENETISDFLIADDGEIAPGWRLIHIKFYDEMLADIDSFRIFH